MKRLLACVVVCFSMLGLTVPAFAAENTPSVRRSCYWQTCYTKSSAANACVNGCFVDEDGDGVCDFVGEGLGCGSFIDEDGDGVCDYAGEYRGYGRFVDEDGDGVCDYAGEGLGCGGRAAVRGGCRWRGRFN